MKCKQCGHRVDPGWAWCPECGAHSDVDLRSESAQVVDLRPGREKSDSDEAAAGYVVDWATNPYAVEAS